jgi:membrane fusion protein (multidrug efflux system)
MNKYCKLRRAQIVVILGIVFLCPNTVLSVVSSGAKVPPAIVEVVVAKDASYREEISSTGTLISIPGIMVKPEIPGRITKICFKSGEVVNKGEVLVEINSDIIKGQLSEAETNLRLSQLNFIRSIALYKTHDISKADFDRVHANYSASKAKVDSLRASLCQTIILAPFNGTLGLSRVSIGDYVNVGQSIVSLQTIDPLRVDFTVPELYQSKININQKVFLKTDAYPGEIFDGTVEAIDAIIDPNNRTLSVRASVPNNDFKLKAGGFVEVRFQLAEQHLILIPQTAIIYAVDGNYVFKVVDGKAEKVKVVLGIKNSDKVVVRSGLKNGDVVITSGQMKVQSGSSVIIAGGEKSKAQLMVF